MRRLLPILLLVLVASAGCKGTQWTFSKNWGGGQPASNAPQPEPKPEPKPEPAPDKPQPKPEPESPKDVIFVLGIDGMD